MISVCDAAVISDPYCPPEYCEEEEEEEYDEYAAMMNDLALDIDKNGVPPIIKQEQNIASVLINELNAVVT